MRFDVCCVSSFNFFELNLIKIVVELLKSRKQFWCLELDLNFTEITTPGPQSTAAVAGSVLVSLGDEN